MKKLNPLRNRHVAALTRMRDKAKTYMTAFDLTEAEWFDWIAEHHINELIAADIPYSVTRADNDGIWCKSNLLLMINQRYTSVGTAISNSSIPPRAYKFEEQPRRVAFRLPNIDYPISKSRWLAELQEPALVVWK